MSTDVLRHALLQPRLWLSIVLLLSMCAIWTAPAPFTLLAEASAASSTIRFQEEADTSMAASKVYLPLVRKSSAPAPKVYWGALVNAYAPTADYMKPGGPFDAFEQRAQKKMSILHWGQPWRMNGQYQPFYAEWFDRVRSRGSIPMLDWGSWHLGYGPNQSQFKLSAIYNGNYDSYIKQWALSAKAWGHPFFLRFNWEMNGNWQFPWSEQLNGNQPGDYVKAWRHVHDIFKQNGVKNVTWVWCPNISGLTTRPMASLYPGDAYVDWTCLDGYNKGKTWVEFETVLTGSGTNWIFNSYQEILTVAPNKPIMLGEFASLEAGDGGTKKATWIKNALLTQLPTKFPKIKAVVWFNWDDRDPALSFPIESSQASINAFAAGIQSTYFAPNTYANLNTSPIPPLP